MGEGPPAGHILVAGLAKAALHILAIKGLHDDADSLVLGLFELVTIDMVASGLGDVGYVSVHPVPMEPQGTCASFVC